MIWTDDGLRILFDPEELGTPAVFLTTALTDGIRGWAILPRNRAGCTRLVYRGLQASILVR
jgi:hypothetical protein